MFMMVVILAIKSRHNYFGVALQLHQDLVHLQQHILQVGFNIILVVLSFHSKALISFKLGAEYIVLQQLALPLHLAQAKVQPLHSVQAKYNN